MIKNKEESDFIIKKLGLNRISKGIFRKDNIDELKDFLKIHKYNYYNIRDRSNSSGKFLYKIRAQEVLEHSKDYSDTFSVYESLAEADDKLLLQGDIYISKDFIILASLSDIKNKSNREAMENPKYTIRYADLKKNKAIHDLERKLGYIVMGNLNKIIDYIISHELIDMVVEFTIYKIPVGINKENIIIWELRNY